MDYDEMEPVFGRPINPEEKDWNRTLLEATQSGSSIDFQKALQNKADVNCCHASQGFRQYTPLHHAAQNGYFNMVKTLVKEGANINAVIAPIDEMYPGAGLDFYFTPAQLAYENGFDEITSYLNREQAKKDIKACVIGFTAVAVTSALAFSPKLRQKASRFANHLLNKGNTHTCGD